MVDTIDQIVIHKAEIKKLVANCAYLKKMKGIFRKIDISLVEITANNEKGTPQTFARPKMAHPTTNTPLLARLHTILVHFPRFSTLSAI